MDVHWIILISRLWIFGLWNFLSRLWHLDRNWKMALYHKINRILSSVSPSFSIWSDVSAGSFFFLQFVAGLGDSICVRERKKGVIDIASVQWIIVTPQHLRLCLFIQPCLSPGSSSNPTVAYWRLGNINAPVIHVAGRCLVGFLWRDKRNLHTFCWFKVQFK